MKYIKYFEGFTKNEIRDLFIDLIHKKYLIDIDSGFNTLKISKGYKIHFKLFDIKDDLEFAINYIEKNIDGELEIIKYSNEYGTKYHNHLKNVLLDVDIHEVTLVFNCE